MLDRVVLGAQSGYLGGLGRHSGSLGHRFGTLWHHCDTQGHPTGHLGVQDLDFCPFLVNLGTLLGPPLGSFW